MKMMQKLLKMFVISALLIWQTTLYGQELTLARNVKAGSQQTTLKVQKQLKDVIKDIKNRFGVDFIYENSLLEGKKVLYAPQQSDNFEYLLVEVLSSVDLSYKKIDAKVYAIVPKTIDKAGLVKKESALKKASQEPIQFFVPDFTLNALNPTLEFARIEKRITGTLTSSEDGQPLIGASILLKGTTTGTISDVNGKYSISVPDEDAKNGVLIFSYIGYMLAERTINDQSVIDVRLESDVRALKDVVVVGYGTQKKGDVTASLSSVAASEFKDQPVTGVGQALQGRAAGVQVSQASNAPGGGVVVRIRGGNSINAGNEPLYVIDGFPVYNSGGTDFNPSDIESVEILKDASATSIYGSRGANGVILITTKRGKQGKGKVEFQTYYGMQQVGKTLPVLNGTEYANFVNEARTNAGQAALFPNPASFGEGTNWQNEIYRSAPIQNHQINFSGGNDKTQYLLSGNLFEQKGVLINSDFKRYSVRLNLNSQVNDWLSVGTSLNVIRSETNATPTDQDGASGAGQSIVYGSYLFSPTQPLRDGVGNYNVNNTAGLFDIGSPVAHSYGTTNNLRGLRVFGNVFADIKIAKDLTFRTSFGTDLSSSIRGIYSSKFLTKRGQQTGGEAAISNGNNSGWLTENTLTYKKNIGENHHFVFLGGFTSQLQRTEGINTAGTGFATENLTFNGLSNATTPGRPSNGGSQWQLNSVLSRINYDFKGKYLLTVTVRADGSSRFSEGNKWGAFPSASVAWRVSEESFLANSKVISDLKVRASYGLTGNTEISAYQSLDIFASQGYNYNFGSPNTLVTSYVPARVGNRGLTWETTTQTDFGIDLSLFNNRINITADYYNKETTDLLFNGSIPSTTGYTAYLKNVGKIRNTGFELGINSINTTGELKWTTNFNISTNKNEIIDLGGDNNIPAGGNASSANIGPNGTGILRIGEPVGVFYGYEFGGIWQTGDVIVGSAQPNARPGDRKYVDLNGDNVINSADRKILGQSQPKFIGGITNTLSYKGIDFSVLMQGVSGNSILNVNRFELEQPNGSTNVSRDMLDRWTPTNPSNTMPRANVAGTISLPSSRQIEDGSFLRVKSIVLGYSLPASLLKRISISSLRIYVSSQNLFTFTNYSGVDPEVSRFGQETLRQGIDYGSYPVNKSYLVGLNLSF
jgi:TonB-dependent starch-binding outer membrane protein SusC